MSAGNENAVDTADFAVDVKTPGVEPVLDRLDALRHKEVVHVRDIVAAFGDATFVPFLLVPAILVISPLSGVPMFSSLCGITIAIIAGQMLLRRDHLWLPEWIMRRAISGDTLHSALSPLHRVARMIDRVSRPKWRFLNKSPYDLLPEALCVIAGLIMPFLELIPFSSSALGFAVVCFSVGFLARDGRFTLAGIGIMAVALLIPINIAAWIIA